MNLSNKKASPSTVNLEEGKIETDPYGNQVAWVSEDDRDGRKRAVIVFRSLDAATREFGQLSDYIWYIRYQQRNRKIEHGEIILNTPAEVQFHKNDEATAKKIEQAYGLNYLQHCNKAEHFIRLGQMSALAWMLGSSWEESFHT